MTEPLSAEVSRLADENRALRAALETACLWLYRLAEAYDAGDTEAGKPAIDALRRGDMDGYRAACGIGDLPEALARRTEENAPKS